MSDLGTAVDVLDDLLNGEEFPTTCSCDGELDGDSWVFYTCLRCRAEEVVGAYVASRGPEPTEVQADVEAQS